RKSLLDKPTKLHAGEIGRAARARSYLLFKIAYLFILLLDFGYDTITIPVHLQTVLDLAGHLIENVAQGVLCAAHQLYDVVFGAKERAEGHGQDCELAHHSLVDLLVRKDVFARR